VFNLLLKKVLNH